jgi:hypothetical protein
MIAFIDKKQENNAQMSPMQIVFSGRCEIFKARVLK